MVSKHEASVGAYVAVPASSIRAYFTIILAINADLF